MSLEETLRLIVREELARALSKSATEKWEGCVRVRDAAKLVGVSMTTIEKWARLGLPMRRRGRVRMVDVGELRAFVTTREAAPKTSAEDFAKDLLRRMS